MSNAINNTVSNIERYSRQLSSGRRINSAADDAAGLAVSEQMNSQIRGMDQGTQNSGMMQDLLRTAEGGLNTITDSLQRIRELSIQAANGTLTDDNRRSIQYEVSQLLDHIDQTARTTQYNTMNLLDGTFTDKNTASYPDGTGAQISIPDASVIGLGLENYSVASGNFDLSRIETAIQMVTDIQATIGAQSNRLDYSMATTSQASLDLAASRSRIADADMAKAVMEFNKEKILMEYQMAAQKRQMEEEEEKNKIFVM